MGTKAAIVAAAALCAWHGTAAQPVQTNPQVIAQAYDRCMATYAVRLSRTEATDEEIFVQATRGCQSLDDQLTAAINAQVPAAQAAQLLQAMDAQAKPNFMAMLERIRSDRQRASGG